MSTDPAADWDRYTDRLDAAERAEGWQPGDDARDEAERERDYDRGYALGV